jgi:1-aminocyclopropane-1-carboxylate deaminase/D-cysteine desulfhydrase-like pyridoxal-dependent ACC family enzyme
LVGSKISTVTAEEYNKLGGPFFTNSLASQLRKEGKNPFIIPVGGSNPVGSFGYLDFVEELITQTRSCLNNSNDNYFDHIVFACGSGGTATGIALGVRLSGISAKVHAIGVCDTPDEFYEHMEESATSLGINFDKFGNPRDWCNIYDGQGLGYAISTKEELEYITSVSDKTGVIFDPVYSGKALFSLKNVISNNRDVFLKGQKVLFVHTGGVLGFYDKIDTLMSLLPNDKVSNLEISQNK